MRYLLDVNALIALAHTGHVFHGVARQWFMSVVAGARGFHTCSITEIGFVRVTVMTGLQPDVGTAKQALDALKASSKVRFELISDDVGVAQLPAFVKRPQSITDGHLLELARKNSLQLVTFDRGIPHALFIGERLA
ncbi:MAG TPA: TA system VapC family ribonuclease toxin [Verrucomicrobiae bacterium]|jgi:toxin-antitoxin system PIN domain toxin|nr:TA system VapC family ribonuclease toxin [Verrucomicrobiae bacterium]